MPDNQLEESLLDVIAGSGAGDLAQDAAEFAFDQLLEDGLIKDIPVLGTVAKLYSTAMGLQGFVFAKKVRLLLMELSSVSPEERECFREQLNRDKNFRTRVGETLVLLLDKLDDLRKTELLARAFAGFIREEYDFTTFQRLAAAIDRCIISDLSYLPRLENSTELEAYVGDVLTGVGLAQIDSMPAIKAPEVKNRYRITSFGQLFLQIVIRGEHRED